MKQNCRLSIVDAAFKGVLCVEDKQDSAMTGVVVHVDSNAICVDEGKTEGDQ